MKRLTHVLLLLWLLASSNALGATPTIFDLVGKWEGGLEFGKMKFRIILRIAKTDDNKVSIKADIPEQGQKGVPVAAILFNHPEVRIEFDRFGAAFNGKVNDAATEIIGAFDEGPGGRPTDVKFIRSTAPDKPEPKKIFTLKPGESTDPRGYWKTSLEVFPGMNARVGLKVARLDDGTASVDMDNLDFGMTDVPGANVTMDQRKLTAEWQMFQTTFEAKLSEDGKMLEGEWKQGGRVTKVKFDRLAKAATILPDDLEFTAAKGSPKDPAGYWKGTLDVGGQKLRLIVKLGRSKDGSYAGSLNSVDQGGRDMALSSVNRTEDKVRLEMKLLRASFDATLNADGTTLEGQWEQGPAKSPLSFKRITQQEAEKKD